MVVLESCVCLRRKGKRVGQTWAQPRRAQVCLPRGRSDLLTMLQPPKPVSAVLSELADTQRFIAELRANINQSLANMGIVAAFMCALAANVYSNPAKTRDCYGNAGYVAMIWIEFFSMGFFFLGISITVLLASDLSGVPDRLLLRHLSQSQRTLTLPSVLTAFGLFCLATGCAPPRPPQLVDAVR